MPFPQPPKPKQSAPKCGFCGGAHRSLDCDADISTVVNPGSVIFCQQCNGPVEFRGPYCIACTFDRVIERAFRGN